ncbi:MAG: hypothetical protein ACRDHF_08425 [Tepidiformaceae bacterium]
MATATLQIAADPAPLEVRPDGRVVSSGSGVQFEYFITWYLRGDTPEQLMSALPTLSLGETHRLIAYYHQHKDEVDAWLAELDREEEEVIREWDARYPPDPGLRARLERRMAEIRAARPH